MRRIISHPIIQKPVFLPGLFTSRSTRNLVTLQELRQGALEAFRHRDAFSFIDISHLTIKRLGDKSFCDQLNQVPPTFFSDIEYPSAARRILDVVLRKSFTKACDAADIPDGILNNCSGYAISAIDGVDKANCLRVCAFLMPLLLDNVISVCVDYTPTNNPTPFALMTDAWYKRGVKIDHLRKAKPRDLCSLIGHAQLVGLSFMFVANEIRHVYENDSIWADLHVMANSVHHSFFLSDSLSNLRLFVRGRAGLMRQAALNDTKVTIRHFEGSSKSARNIHSVDR